MIFDRILSDFILTERLVLRRFKEDDVEDVFAQMSDDYICRMAGIPTFKTPERAWDFMYDWWGNAYAITERGGDDKVIGIIQLPVDLFNRRVKFGYWLAAEYRGKGYMSEVVETLVERIFEDEGMSWCKAIEIDVFLGNEASRNVALKCGFFPQYEEFKECVYSYYGSVESEECFLITRGDYEWRLRGEASYSTAA